MTDTYPTPPGDMDDGLSWHQKMVDFWNGPGGKRLRRHIDPRKTVTMPLNALILLQEGVSKSAYIRRKLHIFAP